MTKIFVFGSNLAGRHGKGAALFARNHRGAIYGQGVGRQGNSYAIPTKGYKPEQIAPMFNGAPENCHLPEGWRYIIEERYD